jgi:hypothetical protein
MMALSASFSRNAPARNRKFESISLQRGVSCEPVVFSQGVLCPDAPPQDRRAPQDRLLTGEAINDLAGAAGEIDKKDNRV